MRIYEAFTKGEPMRSPSDWSPMGGSIRDGTGTGPNTEAPGARFGGGRDLPGGADIRRGTASAKPDDEPAQRRVAYVSMCLAMLRCDQDLDEAISLFKRAHEYIGITCSARLSSLDDLAELSRCLFLVSVHGAIFRIFGLSRLHIGNEIDI